MHISVVIPVFNEEAFISACLDALQNQTRLPDIIYIVDNNSTDASISIAKKYPNVQVVSEPKQGICAATKKGFDEALPHGGILLRCDADCRPTSDWIEKIERTFQQNQNIDAVTGPGETYDVGPIAQRLFSRTYMKPYFFFVGLALKQPPLFGSNFAITSSAWRSIQLTTHLADYQNIHDDIDISYHVKGTITYDHTLVMPISARPFKNVFKMIKRYRAGFRSIFIHWPEKAPWNR